MEAMSNEDQGPQSDFVRGKLKELESSIGFLDRADALARELQSQIPVANTYVAVSGVPATVPPFTAASGIFVFRAVTNPPGAVSVAAAAAPMADWMGVARYSHAVVAELAVVDARKDSKPESLLGIAWHFLALLKLRGHDLLYCPAAATCSWDLVCLKRDRSVEFTVLDDTPRQLTLGQTLPVTLADLEWVARYYDAALRMRDFQTSRRFGLAFNLAYSFNHTADARVAIASVWAGLDALFGQRADRPVAAALARRAADWLGDVTPRTIMNLYTLRCDAVHGRWLASDAGVMHALRSSVSLLRRALVKAVETERATLADWL